MSNTVLIHASRCIYAIPFLEYQNLWKRYLRKRFVTTENKYVTFEMDDERFHYDENDFIKRILPQIPWESRFKALKRGKYIMRLEKSYARKGNTRESYTK